MSESPENDERMQILEMIAVGRISASDGIRLLEALKQESGVEKEFIKASLGTNPSRHVPDETESAKTASDSQTENYDDAKNEGIGGDGESNDVLYPHEVLEGYSPGTSAQTEEAFSRKGIPDPKIEKWKRWWMLPLWVGVGVTVAAGLLMFIVYQATQISFWFACTWIPFLTGVALIFLAWGLRRSRWLHVRVTQEPGEWPRHIAFSFPLPLGLAAWFIRTFKRWIPGMAHTNIEEIMAGMNSITSDEPFYIEVDEGEDGERVEIFIG
jgi:hypothetical protein